MFSVSLGSKLLCDFITYICSVSFLVLYEYPPFRPPSLSPRYRKNLKCCYVVHPTFWVKVVTWFISTFTVSEVKHKIRYIDGVRYMFDHMRPEQLEIPQFVWDYDRRENGVDYYKPDMADSNGL